MALTRGWCHDRNVRGLGPVFILSLFGGTSSWGHDIGCSIKSRKRRTCFRKWKCRIRTSCFFRRNDVASRGPHCCIALSTRRKRKDKLQDELGHEVLQVYLYTCPSSSISSRAMGHVESGLIDGTACGCVIRGARSLNGAQVRGGLMQNSADQNGRVLISCVQLVTTTTAA
ncbi:hypothetical protein EDD15DRAFT_2325962 [Pisolithus albus]|nr:hypothetical protein EDD15DRAFT_2325962 [Pisolithus albus]